MASRGPPPPPSSQEESDHQQGQESDENRGDRSNPEAEEQETEGLDLSLHDERGYII